GDDRDRHADRGDLVAADGSPRPGQSAHAVDEQRERDDVAGVDEVLRLKEDRPEDHLPSISFSAAPSGRSGFRLNIPSIRSVTRKPPTTLIVPNAIAITSNACSSTP